MKYRVCILTLHFGKELPKSFPLFLESCKYNVNFEWHMFTDTNLSNYEWPTNFKVTHTSLRFIKELAEKKLKMKIWLEKPYKLCDLRGAYGIIFEDYLQNYDFWGYCDYDVLFGNLEKFITDSILEEYDKVFTLGHLSLIRNNSKCNEAFMYESDETNSYKTVFSISNPCWFDENIYGINKKFEQQKLKIYKKVLFLDKSIVHERFCSVSKKELEVIFEKLDYCHNIPINYKYQLFTWEKGSVLKYYVKKDVKCQEYAYIHFRKELPVFVDQHERIIICKQGFINKDFDITKEVIIKYNPPRNTMVEYLEIQKKRWRLYQASIKKDGHYSLKLILCKVPFVMSLKELRDKRRNLSV